MSVCTLNSNVALKPVEALNERGLVTYALPAELPMFGTSRNTVPDFAAVPFNDSVETLEKSLYVIVVADASPAKMPTNSKVLKISSKFAR